MFVVVILRSDKATSQPGRKTFVLLGCKRGGKYMKYKYDVQASIYDIRKSESPFKLRGKPNSNWERLILKVIYGYHNHDLTQSLVGHPFAGG